MKKKDTSGHLNLGKETELLEYKKTTGEKKEAVISICAMLNKHGRGTVYFGVKNDGTVIGHETGANTLRDIGRAITDHIKPVIYPTVETEMHEDKEVIKVSFEGSRRPYLAYGKSYIRVSDEDKQMEQDTYDDLLRARDNQSKAWESQVSEYEIKDIDKDVFDRYLRRARDVGRIALEENDPALVLKKLGLTKGKKLLNAGAALFVDSGINDLQMAKFASNERLTITDIRRHTGSILGLVDVAMDYLIDAMNWRAEISGGRRRKEIPEIPVEALREAVVNAFAHRLIESGETVQIMIFRNRIEIYSPGAFPEKTSPEEFMNGNEKAIRRNKLIAGTLYYSKDMETLATGLKKIRDVCNEADVKFGFERNAYGFTVIFYRYGGEGWGWMRENIPDGAPVSTKNGDTNGDTIPKNYPQKLSPNNAGKRNKNRENILMLLKNNPHITREELSGIIGISVPGIRYHIKKLTDEGKVKYIGTSRSGHWEVQ